MSKIIAYLRASTDKQDLNHQKLELLEFARKKSLAIDEFIEITVSSRKTNKQRRIDELLERLVEADTLMVTELSRLGRSTSEVIDLVNRLTKRNVRLIICKQNLDISQQDINSKVSLTFFALFSDLERDLTAY
jgi:DNA invertase Pin-like site-specific DNA recombinase